MQKTTKIILFAVIGAVCLGGLIYQEKYFFSRDTRKSNVNVVGNVFINLSNKVSNGDVRKIEVFYIPKNSMRPIACEKECIENEYVYKSNIEFALNPRQHYPQAYYPLSDLLPKIVVTDARSSRDYYWLINWRDKDGKVIVSVYGAKSGDVLVNNSVAVHLDNSLSNWVSSVFSVSSK